MRRKLAAGNWKMNGTSTALTELQTLANTHQTADCDILICPPAPLLHRAAQTTHNSAIRIGGQDCHPGVSGAHTGDISATMLKDAGATAVIVGHSERRQDRGESNEDVHAKASAAMAAGLLTIICVGESLTQRQQSDTLDVIKAQLSGSTPDVSTGDNLIIAYEPIWAIGSGLVPSIDQIGEVHDFIRTQLDSRFGADIGTSVRLLYGGSVNA